MENPTADKKRIIISNQALAFQVVLLDLFLYTEAPLQDKFTRKVICVTGVRTKFNQIFLIFTSVTLLLGLLPFPPTSALPPSQGVEYFEHDKTTVSDGES